MHPFKPGGQSLDHHMCLGRAEGLQLLAASMLTVMLPAFAVVVAAASSAQEARMEDRCDAATFLPKAACGGNGVVIFAVFCE